MYIHRVVDDLPHALGKLILDDGGNDRGLLALIERHHGHDARGINDVGVTADTGKRFLDAFELTDRGFELAADARVGPGAAAHQLRRAGAQRRQ